MGISACGVNWNITLKDNLEEGSKTETGHILKLHSYNPSIYLRATLGKDEGAQESRGCLLEQ